MGVNREGMEEGQGGEKGKGRERDGPIGHLNLWTEGGSKNIQQREQQISTYEMANLVIKLLIKFS